MAECVDKTMHYDFEEYCHIQKKKKEKLQLAEVHVPGFTETTRQFNFGA